jgi:prephenate dehydratase
MAMAEVTPVVYYVGMIADKPGEGARVLNAFKEAGINLVAFLGYPKARKAEIIIAVEEKAPALGPVARKVGLALGKKQKALLVTGEDRPGALAEVMGKAGGRGHHVPRLTRSAGAADASPL